APRVALFRRHFQAPLRQHPAWRRGRDIGLDAVERIDGDAFALAQAVHQLAVIDRTTAEGRFRRVRPAAELRYLAQNLVVFHGMETWDGVGSDGMDNHPITFCPTRGMLAKGSRG